MGSASRCLRRRRSWILTAGWRLLVPALLIGTLGFLAWQIMVAASPWSPNGDAAEAIAGNWNSAVLVRRAESYIKEPQSEIDWAEVRRLARRALQANPLEERALVLLASAAAVEGDELEAAKLFSMAGARTLRDPRAQLWLFQARLGDDDFAAALEHGDVVLRVHPRLRPTLLPYLMSIAAVPAGREPLVAMLEKSPNWRGWFLDAFSKQAADPSDATPVYSALQSGPRPPSGAELRPHLQRLIEAGRFEQALMVWMSFLPPDRTAEIGYLFNGSFSHPVTNLPFDWVIGNVHGAEIGVAPSPMGGGKALRVQFGKGRVPFRHVRKLMVLPPGEYELSGEAMAAGLSNSRGLRWSLACAEGPRKHIVSTARITGTARTAIAQRFSVPASGCRAQWLQLELAARIPPEQDVDGGTVWYDSLRIRRTGDPNPS